MGCCGSGNKKKKVINESILDKAEELSEKHGCYLTYANGELYSKWSEGDPEGSIIAFAKAKTAIPPGRLAQAAHFVGFVGNEKEFYKGIIDFIIECCQYSEELSLPADSPEKSFTPFMLAVHQPGNNVIGDRTLKCLPGKLPLNIDGINGAAAVSLSSTVYDTRSQTIAEFVEAAKSAEGCFTYLDTAGKVPPI